MSWTPNTEETALIATAVTLIGILITNQAKVSEFRQLWINALRDDAATLISHTLIIHTAKAEENIGINILDEPRQFSDNRDMEHPKTLTDAIRYYSDPANCVAVVKAMRWDGGEPPCPYCGERKHYWLATQMRWKCASCRKQFSVKVGTIFEDSPLSLEKWLIATWMVANCRNGVSSYEIMRTIGVTQKSAWFMLHRIRLAMQDTSGGMLSGEVEVDESFIGGKARNMHLKKRKAAMNYRHQGKTVVMGMMERGGKVRATVIADRQKPILHEQIERNVEAGSNVFTDELVSYWGLNEKYVHQVINHAMKYVEGNVHTNSLENFWALLKRGLSGTYVSVEPFHLFRYIDEQAFRYNNRRLTDWGRFSELLKQISNKRLTYAEVTGRGLETASF